MQKSGVKGRTRDTFCEKGLSSLSMESIVLLMKSAISSCPRWHVSGRADCHTLTKAFVKRARNAFSFGMEPAKTIMRVALSPAATSKKFVKPPLSIAPEPHVSRNTKAED